MLGGSWVQGEDTELILSENQSTYPVFILLLFFLLKITMLSVSVSGPIRFTILKIDYTIFDTFVSACKRQGQIYILWERR